jgi:hypothetical protein
LIRSIFDHWARSSLQKPEITGKTNNKLIDHRSGEVRKSLVVELYFYERFIAAKINPEKKTHRLAYCYLKANFSIFRHYPFLGSSIFYLSQIVMQIKMGVVTYH